MDSSLNVLQNAGANVTDPVCGMKFPPEKAAGKVEYEGQTFYFCNVGCLEKFRQNPLKYLSPETTITAHECSCSEEKETTAVYTCPMDPEIRQSHPGPCPKCGMALEPLNVEPAFRTDYVCPMHPEIMQATPGNCSICGMALEPRTTSLDMEQNPELTVMKRRFWISLFLTRPCPRDCNG